MRRQAREIALQILFQTEFTPQVSIDDIFRMTEVNPKTRAKIIIQLGRAVNHELASNCTEALVFELVSVLDPENKILSDNFYKQFVEGGE